MPIEMHDHLPNKPLIEALLEARWGTGDRPDTAYPVSVGRVYERLKSDYPHVEDLPVAQLPPDMAVHYVRHRFRTQPGGWPVVQIGPGVASLNSTDDYLWTEFRRRAVQLHRALTEAMEGLGVEPASRLALQYIDGVELDHDPPDILAFWRDNMQLRIELPDLLFESQATASSPAEANLSVLFQTRVPTGRIELTAGTGVKDDRKAAIWRITVYSEGKDAVTGWDSFDRWLDESHHLAHHWFFALIQGPLLERFKQGSR